MLIDALSEALGDLDPNIVKNKILAYVPAETHSILAAPARLLCKGPDSDTCLTAPQVAALKKIYDGPKNSKGDQIFPGFSVGGEGGFGGWPAWITGPGPGKSTQYAFGTQFFKNMVFDDAQWDFKTFNLDRDPKVADDKVGQRLNATNPDLSAFKKRGGKLIIYHGWSDAAIPPVNAIQYYQSVAAKMFMVPGMQHCGGGPGPNTTWLARWKNGWRLASRRSKSSLQSTRAQVQRAAWRVRVPFVLTRR